MTRKMLSGEEESRQAYEEIGRLTEQYNAMNGGKWRGLMSATPRNLPVFGEGRTTLQQDSIEGRFVARNACDYQLVYPFPFLRPVGSKRPLAEREGARGGSIHMLGHSMNAVSIPKGAELSYTFTTEEEGEAVLYTAMIPTQPSDRGDLRYQVQLDDQQPIVISLKEPYRSEQWKKNVLRCQALKKTPINVSKGQHTLKVKALDDHIIMDQWMIDFNPNRQFYNIPIK